MHSHRPFIIGYVEDQALCSVTEDDARKLTHINVAFGRVVDGKVRVSRTTTLDYIQTLKTYNQDLRVLLSVGGWGAGGFSESASSAKSRSQLAASAVELVRRYGLDGIDLDWEYPCYSVAGIVAPTRQGEFHTAHRGVEKQAERSRTERRQALSLDYCRRCRPVLRRRDADG